MAPSAELLDFGRDQDTDFLWIFPVIAIILSVAAVIVQKFQRGLAEGRPADVVANYIKMILVLTISWSFIYWGDMQIVPIVSSRFLGLVLEAVIYSTAVVLGIILLDA